MEEIEAPPHGLLVAVSFNFWVRIIGKECTIVHFQSVCSPDTKPALAIEPVLRMKVTHRRTELMQGLFVFSATLGVIGHSLGAA